MRRSLPADVASLCDAVRSGEATASSAVALRHHWTGELNVYDGAGNVTHVTLTALQALFAEGEASLWQLAAAILRGDRAGALAAAERLGSVTAARAKLEAAPDPVEEERRAGEALAAARMGARRAELQPPVPPWVATAPVTRGYRIVRQGGEAVEFRAVPSGPLGGRCNECGEPDLLAPGLHDTTGRWWCLDCLADLAAEPGATVEGQAPRRCGACEGSGEVEAAADASVRVTCTACGGRRLAVGSPPKRLTLPQRRMLRDLRSHGSMYSYGKAAARVLNGLAAEGLARPSPEDGDGHFRPTDAGLAAYDAPVPLRPIEREELRAVAATGQGREGVRFRKLRDALRDEGLIEVAIGGLPQLTALGRVSLKVADEESKP